MAKNLYIRMLRKLGLLGSFNVEAHLSLGKQSYRIPLIKGLGLANLYVKESWLSKLIEASGLDEQDTFVDVGVNLGQTLLQLRAVNEKAQYMGFEPNVNCCFYTNELIRLNKLEKCTVLNVALSDERTLVYFEFDSDADPRASINTRLRPGYFSKRMQVMATSFDTDFAQSAPSFVKIDVEGAELAVIKGMQKKLQEHKPLVVCEVLDSHGDSLLDYTQKLADELADLLHQLDYKIIRLHQDENCEQLLSFQPVERFEIKNWEPSSMRTNDYVFCHREKLPQVLDILQNKIIHA
ncbi:MAG: FkbM family methyltransferase [Bacteroidota bacterium]